MNYCTKIIKEIIFDEQNLDKHDPPVKNNPMILRSITLYSGYETKAKHLTKVFFYYSALVFNFNF